MLLMGNVASLLRIVNTALQISIYLHFLDVKIQLGLTFTDEKASNETKEGCFDIA